MSYTIKGSLTSKKNKDGLYPLCIRYTLDRTPYYLTLKSSDGKVITVDKNDFDTGSGLMKKTKNNYHLLNTLIRTHVQIVEDVATTLSVQDFKQVKELYLQRLEEIKEEEKLAAEKKQKEEFSRKLSGVITHFNVEEAKEQKQTLSKSLIEIDAELERYRAEGLIKETDEEEVEFRKLLIEFPKKYETQPRTQQQYKSWVGNLLEFSQETKTPLLFSQLDFDFYHMYGQYLMFDRVESKKLRKKRMSDNSFGGQVKKLKQFVSWCRKYKKIRNVSLIYEDFPVLKEEVDVDLICLNESELDLLYAEYRDLVTDSKKVVIDITVLQSSIGLRYGDIYASKWNVKTIGGVDLLTGKTEKTDTDFFIPLGLGKRIVEILGRYGYKMDHMVEQVYNRELKVLLKSFYDHYGINQELISYEKKKFGEPVPLQAFKYELATSHSNRRFFISYWYQRGVDDKTIMKMIGSKDSVVLQGYKRKDIVATSKSLQNTLKQIGVVLQSDENLAVVAKT